MITVVVQFNFKTPIDRAESVRRWREHAHLYQGMEGLIRKYYAIAPDALSGCGVYLWESREAAERVYNGDWGVRNRRRYGEPIMTWYDCPMVVDNSIGQVILEGEPAVASPAEGEA